MTLIEDKNALTPKVIVSELDKYVIGQGDAKKAVAIALRNRYRRKIVPDELREEIAPKNIIMIGPTGVGKTELARRLAKLCNAPFVKVEATKYTEVGYVGRDVESIIRDLLTCSINLVKKEMRSSVLEEAQLRAENQLLKSLLPGSDSREYQENEDRKATKEKFRELLRNGELDDKEVEITVLSNASPAIEMFSGAGFEGMGINLSDLNSMFGGQKQKRKKVAVKQAKEILLNEEIEKLLDMDKVVDEAIRRTENDGIVFIDEIDKIAIKSKSASGAEVSREGVQRDLLPIVEGSQINTKYGPVKTDHILFIASGAFHMSKPADLIPELQGRFPIRVELKSLTKEDFIEILTKPKNALLLQYVELLKTEGVELSFSDDAIAEIAEYAFDVNENMENIGARRLHTIIEKLIEDISFNAPELTGQKIVIDREMVKGTLKEIIDNNDLSKYIL
ncbi:MAG: ATP-dependent protease ATPase subunit HslU [Spirochaetota bacterium]|jgi:ATP-dependent HslUV protease ATP-binding subunit HslU|nr:ATP-dependent protease ATPase subunit HslU [Spirochaetota bacterium]